MQNKKLVTLVIAVIMTTGIIRSNEGGFNEKTDQLPEEFIFQGDNPAFDADIFRLRRQKLMEKMEGSIAIISATTGNDFIYLTGYTGDSQSVAVLVPSSAKPYTLFVVPREPMATLWEGERPGVEEAVAHFGADSAYPVGEFNTILPQIIAGKNSVSSHSGDRISKELLTRLGGVNITVHNDLDPIIHEMRVIKDRWEIAQLEKAVEVTSQAHIRVMKTLQPNQKEYDAQAEIEYVFMKNGLSTGFSSIVGSGPNAAVLHYSGNDRNLQEGDLLLMDIGAASQGYVADVTRTIPVSGKFTKEQREIYSLVLHANEEAIRKMVPGKRILDGHHTATGIITRGLYELGLITDTTSWWQKRFYIHFRNSHYIVLHVHVVGSYGNLEAADRDSYILNPEILGRELLPGMVLTIEPGIYLIADRLEYLHGLFGDRATKKELDAFAEKVRPIYEKYAGIGIRIEDDVLITEEGNIVLSANAPKSVKDIEAIMNR